MEEKNIQPHINPGETQPSAAVEPSETDPSGLPVTEGVIKSPLHNVARDIFDAGKGKEHANDVGIYGTIHEQPTGGER